jgi:flavin-dependent dehydrogenase
MHDLLVAGGGPSGLATAIEAASRGFRVALVEPKPGTIDKACGEGLMPGAWRDLQALGVDIPRSHRFEGITYVRDQQAASGRFASGAGRGVRRLVRHDALRARADALGVDRMEGRVTDVVQDDRSVTAAGVQARWLVAADGLRSPIRRTLGLDRPSRWPKRYGIRRHFAVKPWSDHVEVHWADDAEAYVTPVDDELVGIAFLFGDTARAADAGKPGRPFDRMLDRFPALRERLSNPASQARGAGPFAHASSQRVAGRVLLVGYAAGYLDPITGEGIKLGLRGARAAVDAIVAGRPVAYEKAWRKHYRTYLLATGGLLVATRWRWTRKLVLPVVRGVPGLMPAILATLAE